MATPSMKEEPLPDSTYSFDDTFVAAPLIQEEPFINSTESADEIDIDEFKLEPTDREVQLHQDQQLDIVSDATSWKSEEIKISHIYCSVHTASIQALEQKKNLPCYHSCTRFMQWSFAVDMVINSTRNLLNDFYHISQCQKSLYSSKVPIPPLMLKCQKCGAHFIGNRNRILRLIDHFESKHQKNGSGTYSGRYQEIPYSFGSEEEVFANGSKPYSSAIQLIN